MIWVFATVAAAAAVTAVIIIVAAHLFNTAALKISRVFLWLKSNIINYVSILTANKFFSTELGTRRIIVCIINHSVCERELT